MAIEQVRTYLKQYGVEEKFWNLMYPVPLWNWLRRHWTVNRSE